MPPSTGTCRRGGRARLAIRNGSTSTWDQTYNIGEVVLDLGDGLWEGVPDPGLERCCELGDHLQHDDRHDRREHLDRLSGPDATSGCTGPRGEPVGLSLWEFSVYGTAAAGSSMGGTTGGTSTTGGTGTTGDHHDVWVGFFGVVGG